MSYPLRKPLPRIPLHICLPDNLPGIKEIINFSVESNLGSSVEHKSEIELEGSYRININYCGQNNDSRTIRGDEQVSCGCFFENLQVLDGGLLEECDSVSLYNWSWEDQIHTFVEKDKTYLDNNLVMKVHDCSLKLVNEKSISGYLILKIEKKQLQERQLKTLITHGKE